LEEIRAPLTLFETPRDDEQHQKMICGLLAETLIGVAKPWEYEQFKKFREGLELPICEVDDIVKVREGIFLFINDHLSIASYSPEARRIRTRIFIFMHSGSWPPFGTTGLNPLPTSSRVSKSPASANESTGRKLTFTPGSLSCVSSVG